MRASLQAYRRWETRTGPAYDTHLWFSSLLCFHATNPLLCLISQILHYAFGTGTRGRNRPAMCVLRFVLVLVLVRVRVRVRVLAGVRLRERSGSRSDRLCWLCWLCWKKKERLN